MSWPRSLAAAVACLPVVWTTLPGQRAPVLHQVKVRHPYYFREMFIPQVTSGPSAAAWSPDGTELIYSMQGSLWRQRIGESEARQLTDGPGYDYQPDWAPDGRRIVYASYRDDAMELRLLDLASGVDTRLVGEGAVSLEPRWSPDGRRVAFTSTLFEGRWHVFTVNVDAHGPIAAPERVTADRDSGLPRYYYNAFDQYLSPTWSPDGRELILVSNRGHVWGSGGFWRAPAQPGGEGREIRDEETTWKARPDWSRDGRRVAYSSYMGRQWHQLWIMTADGANPLQLTYGDFDATAPRWSPDGRRISFVSNEGGDTSLWVLDVPGGRRVQVRPVRRIYRSPVGTLHLRVTDAGGRSMPARVSVTGADGRSFAPDTSWRHADDGFDRRERRFEYGYFHTGGAERLTLPAGRYTIEVSHGPEYRVDRRTVNIRSGGEVRLRSSLARLVNLDARGWRSADLHVHMNYGGAYRNTPRRLAFQARAEDLDLLENLIVNKEGRIPDIGYRVGRDPASTPMTLVVHDQEFHTSVWGHVGLLGLREHVLLPGYSGYAATAAASLSPTNAQVADLAREQGAAVGYVHPFDADPDPADTTRPLTAEFPIDVALGKVDYYEALGFVDDPMATAHVWYRVLNCGFRLPAGAGTDAMANFASLRGPVGMNRVYVHAGTGPMDHRRMLDSLRAGRTFATNGPLVEVEAGGRGPGQELILPADGADVPVRISLRSNVPVDHLELVSNGHVVHEVPLAGDRTRADTVVRLSLRASGWLLLRARSDRAVEPVLDLYPYATTSPVYVSVGGRPARSAADAEYFLNWIARVESAARESQSWNTAGERDDALEAIANARAEFERRRTEARGS
ncbi:MAG TPA: CehA/McbA family metallohydrolase [Gemmatimonadales bacterium]|nr:CehA/McbA family metallohydrolase [Gemmatimonadales bacterium]